MNYLVFGLRSWGVQCWPRILRVVCRNTDRRDRDLIQLRLLCCCAVLPGLQLQRASLHRRILHRYYSRQSIFCLLSFVLCMFFHFPLRNAGHSWSWKQPPMHGSNPRLFQPAVRRSPGRNGVWFGAFVFSFRFGWDWLFCLRILEILNPRD